MESKSVVPSDPNQIMETPKRRMLSISEKVELIKMMQKSPKSKKAIAAQFGIPINTVGTIYASRERILEKCKGDFTNMNLKRLRPSTYPDIEESLLDWYIKNHTNGHISCLTLRAKALQYAKALGHDNFSASNGWIERFKVRHNLKFRRNKDKKNPSVSADLTSKTVLDSNKSDISQSGNSSETDISNHHDSNRDKPWENAWNEVTEPFEVKQECPDAYDFDAESHNSLQQNAVETGETNASPSHIVPEVHFSESPSDNQNCLVNNPSSNVNYHNPTIQNIESAFNVILSYVQNCDGNVDEKTSLALKELKKFITKERVRKSQSKITDFFSYAMSKKY